VAKGKMLNDLANRFNSLKVRLIFSALIMVVVVLPIIGITLNNAFEVQIKSALRKELSAYSYSILAVAEAQDQELFMPEQLLENQFNVIQSGLYALISRKESVRVQAGQKAASSGNNNLPLWRSASLLGLDLPEGLSSPLLGQSMFYEVNIEQNPHLVYSFSVSFTEGDQSLPVTLHIIKDQSDFIAISKEFTNKLWLWLLILMLILICIQLIWLTWTLKPLSVLKQEIASVEQGKTQRLEHTYPQELEQVTRQVNILLKTEQEQRQRYRNALSDLAHSLKTPLAVIQSQAELSDSSIEQLARINNTIEYQLKRAQSAGQSSWHLGTAIKPVAGKLSNSLSKIYRDKDVTLDCQIEGDPVFRGDEADLMEILGNLLDNAYKAANGLVILQVHTNDQKLSVSVMDDGQGISEDKRHSILQRGTRADTYQSGHGIGLAIVRDLVQSYHGTLTVSNSESLGGARFEIRFPVSA